MVDRTVSRFRYWTFSWSPCQQTAVSAVSALRVQKSCVLPWQPDRRSWWGCRNYLWPLDDSFSLLVCKLGAEKSCGGEELVREGEGCSWSVLNEMHQNKWVMYLATEGRINVFFSLSWSSYKTIYTPGNHKFVRFVDLYFESICKTKVQTCLRSGWIYWGNEHVKKLILQVIWLLD